MNEANKHFLDILKAALKGEPASPQLIGEQWEAVFRLAAIHSVLPLIYEAVHVSLRQTDFSHAAQFKRQVRDTVILQTMRTGEFLDLNRELTEAGVTPLVVKGVVCRSLYPRPDHRPSSDEDVLIPPEQFELCHQVMTRFGMHTTLSGEEMASAYEVPYRKQGSPLYIELHKHLFPPQSDAYGDWNRFFADVFDRSVEVSVPGGTVRTMDHTDHLFYLICHAFKHFLHSGFGIRQVCDITLYANCHGSRIDWERVLNNCRSLRADRFAAALFAIGRKHLTFDPDRACYPDCWRSIDVDETAMLEDILCAGVYGSSDRSRQHSSTITLDAVTAQKQGKTSAGGLVASVFPPARELEGRYPYLKQHPWLLPAAWCSRLLHYAREVSATRSNAAEALKIGSERVELLRQYGILK